jgi:hypothetical protein
MKERAIVLVLVLCACIEGDSALNDEREGELGVGSDPVTSSPVAEFSRMAPELVEQDGTLKIISGYMDVPAQEVTGSIRDHVGMNVTFTIPLTSGNGGGVAVTFFRDGMDHYVKRLLVNGRSVRSTAEFDNLWIGPPNTIAAIASADSLGASLGALRLMRFTPGQTERLKQMARTAIERGAPAKVGDLDSLFW